MASLQIGWIDYSNEHRNKVMAVLDLLTEKGAVDELGIGQIRDRFSEMFFPGTSTLQTRAKYFLIVPYILMEIEKKRFDHHTKFLDELHEIELDLIDVLKNSTTEGVIGGRSGRKLKRKPSSIYWNGLRTYEIFKYSNLTLFNYATSLVARQKLNQPIASLGPEEEMEEGPQNEHQGVYWHCIFPPDNWQETLQMDLTYEEAKFLRGKMIRSSQSEGSLLAFLLKQDWCKVSAIDKFEEIQQAFDIPEHIKPAYQLANAFSKFFSGANIRYNFLFSKGENEVANVKWEEWLNSPFVKKDFEAFQHREVTTLLNIRNPRLSRFLDNWQKAVMSCDLKAIDEIIIKREVELKTRDRAKLINPKITSNAEWVGSEKLQYRFSNAKQLMDDIFKGLRQHEA